MIEGRIIKGVGGLYFVQTAQVLYKCKARGVFRKKNITPTVGDWVVIQVTDEADNEGYIHHIQDRKNLLLRPRIANVDCALILFANRSPALNLDLLDRLILLAEEAGLEACIGINKMDLGDSENLEMLCEIYGKIGYKVFGFDALKGMGIEDIRPYLTGRVSVLAGPSGVGKSSIANKLYRAELMETGAVSLKIDRGRHTTRHAELIEFAEDSFIADTPGFTSLELNHIPAEELAHYFHEFETHRRNCRFADCRHIDEPGCAVKDAVEQDIHPLRYRHYVDIYKELKV